jgi:uncharacterized protein YndB with AHSA1/START domain
MRWVLVVLAAGAVATAFVVLVGALLPVGHTATLERRVAGAPQDVWRVITDVEAFPAWRSDVQSVEPLPSDGGRPVWREVTRHGATTMAAVEERPPDLLVTRIADEGLPYGGTWTFRLDPDGQATRVTVTEDGEVYNVFFRFMSRFVFGHEATMRTYLDALEGRMARSDGAP